DAARMLSHALVRRARSGSSRGGICCAFIVGTSWSSSLAGEPTTPARALDPASSARASTAHQPRSRDCSFEIHLRAKTLEIAVNDGDCQSLARPPVGQRAVSRLELAVALDLVPPLRVPAPARARPRPCAS